MSSGENNFGRVPLAEDEIVVHVPAGSAKNVRISEVDIDGNAEITVQVSKKRRPGKLPVLGVIVK